MVAFINDGLTEDEPVMVAVTAEHTRWLTESLTPSAVDRVTFVDMARLGRNPARIIPAWQDFVSSHAQPFRPVRGVGEPIWPERHHEELLECQLHEALLNLAIAPRTPLWLICPYDTELLSPAVVEEAHRSHPVIVEAGVHRGSSQYAGRAHAEALFAATLSRPETGTREALFTSANLGRLPAYVKLELYVAGLSLDHAAQLAAAAHRLALDSQRRGSSRAVVRIWSEPYALICEVADDAVVSDPLLGRTLPTGGDGGLWEANQTSDLVQLRSTATGTTVRIISWW